MNYKQKTVIIIFIVLLLCCAIIVPYEGTETKRVSIIGKPQGDGIFGPITGYHTSKNKLFLGYYPIFSPPTKENIGKAFSNSNSLFIEYSYEANINLIRLIIQICILLIISTGLILLFADSKQKHSPPK